MINQDVNFCSIVSQALLPIVFCIGCASTGPLAAEKPIEVAATNESAGGEEGYLLSGIADSSIPTGKCALVLWTLDERAPTPVLKFIVGEEGEATINGSPMELKLVGSGGVTRYGVAENQIYVADGRLKVTVRFDFALGFEGGNYVENGLIAIEDKFGWRSVTPAAGLAGCRGE